jgi:hypothetical protein
VAFCPTHGFTPRPSPALSDTRVTPDDKRRAVAQRAAEIAERRAVFDANNSN